MMALEKDKYIITVNTDLLNRPKVPDNARPILVRNTRTGVVTEERRIGLPLGGEVIFGPPRQDGATVWVEAPMIQRYA